MIDSLKTLVGKAGLLFPFKGIGEVESASLPDGAAFDGENFFVHPGADQDLQLAAGIRALASYVLAGASAKRVKVFYLALFEVSENLGSQAQTALSTSASFEAAVTSLESPVARLVAIHGYNALIRHGMSYADATTVKLTDWGSTSDFFTGRAPCSLLPLLGAYCPEPVFRSFPLAIASLAMSGLAQVTHSDVRETYADILRSTFNG